MPLPTNARKLHRMRDRRILRFHSALHNGPFPKRRILCFLSEKKTGENKIVSGTISLPSRRADRYFVRLNTRKCALEIIYLPGAPPSPMAAEKRKKDFGEVVAAEYFRFKLPDRILHTDEQISQGI
jgi:hypothetical protein